MIPTEWFGLGNEMMVGMDYETATRKEMGLVKKKVGSPMNEDTYHTQKCFSMLCIVRRTLLIL